MNRKITRRNMLKSAGAVAAAAPWIVPSTVFGQSAPSNAILAAGIGVGRMGKWDIENLLYQGIERNVRVVATCDVDRQRAEACRDKLRAVSEKKTGKAYDVKAYTDYRDVLARKDIDVVTVCTSEHWHAKIAIEAARAGKDIFVQKPMTYTINEGKLLVKAVRENQRVLQVGSQQRSSAHFRKVCELVRNGALGKLETIEVVIPTDGGYGSPISSTVPDQLNYDMWLGPRPVVAYDERRVHPKSGYGRPGWLQVEQYCLGMITGWGAHMYDIAQWALGCDLDGGPRDVMAVGEFPKRGLWDVHTGYIGEANYANGVKMISHDGRAGVKFIGEKGWIWVQRGKFNAAPYDLLKTPLDDNAERLPVSNEHMSNFLDCVRSRKDPIAPVEAGHRSNTVCVLHHIAMKLGRRLRWDPKAEKFVQYSYTTRGLKPTGEDDTEANAMLEYEYRKGYEIG